MSEVVKSEEGGVDGSGEVDVEGSEVGRGDWRGRTMRVKVRVRRREVERLAEVR